MSVARFLSKRRGSSDRPLDIIMRSFAIASMLVAAAPNAVYPPISSKRLSQHVKVLASDAFEGRGVGSVGEQKTVAYLVRQFKRYGLEPGGPAGSWTQLLAIRRITHAGPVAASLSLGGTVSPIRDGADIAVNSTLRGGQVAVESAPLVFVGYGIVAPDLGWDDLKGMDLRGKIAVVMPGEPPVAPFNPLILSSSGGFRQKAAALASRGAVGVLQISRVADGQWVTNANSASAPQYASDEPEKGKTPQFTGFVADAWLRNLLSSRGLDLDRLVAAEPSRKFHPSEIPDAGMSVRFDIHSERIETRNILARVPGKRWPRETLLYTAHWDHLGIGRPNATGDRIYNGAMDNASGLAGLLELARAFRNGPPPGRSVVFIALTGEELGFWGSRYYVEHPVYPLSTTVADINMDLLSMLGPTRAVQVLDFGLTTIDRGQVPRLAARQGRTVDMDGEKEAGLFNRSDQIIFARYGGVPALNFGWGSGRIDSGPPDNYMAERYHRPNDEWSPAIDFRGAAQNLQLSYWLGEKLANSRIWPDWIEGTEFKPLRARSAAARKP